MKDASDPHLLSGGYALHSVTEDEAAEVEAAMVTSEELRGEVAELSDTAVLLGLSVPPEDPPPALRARLLDLISQTPQLPGEAGDRTEEQASDPARAQPQGNHVAVGRARRRRPAVLLALAAVAVLLFGGGLLVDRVLQGQGTGSPSAFARLTSASDVHRSEAPVTGGGMAIVYWSKSLDESAVVLNGVEQPGGRSLQLWAITGAKVVSAGLYAPTAGQHYRILKGAMTPNQALAVSVEPRGGSPKPTTKPIVVVPIT
jgi:anti-sigma-K factor RskA